MDKSRIDRACQWYMDNRDLIRTMLPLELRHPNGQSLSLYPANWDITYWVTRWQENRLATSDAEQLICGQLRPLFEVVRDRRVSHG
jgi:hypothetical protein